MEEGEQSLVFSAATRARGNREFLLEISISSEFLATNSKRIFHYRELIRV